NAERPLSAHRVPQVIGSTSALLQVRTPHRLRQRLPRIETGLQRVPVGDFLLAVLPTEQTDLSVDLARKIDQAELEAFELAAACFDLVDEVLELLDQFPQLGAALE